jgi:hypothetical protein
MASQSTTNAGETALACTDLSGLASSLRSLVSRFQLQSSGAQGPANFPRHTPPSVLRTGSQSFTSLDL